MGTGPTLFKCANGELFNIDKILTVEHWVGDFSDREWTVTLDDHESDSIEITQQDYERLLSILTHII